MKVEDQNISIKICFSIISIMKQYIQNGLFSLEAGGILIGKENISNNDLIVKYLTVPYKKDKRKHCRFLRQDNQHIRFFEKIYNEHDEVYRYIGEWHTHDENIPMYSKMDLNNWKKIYKDAPEDINHYHIIVGRKAFRIWKVNNYFDKPQIVKTIYWEDVKLNSKQNKKFYKENS